MEITLLIKSIMGLVIILSLLLLLLFYKPKKKIEKKKVKVTRTDGGKLKTDLESLRSIIKSKKSTTKELKEALDLVLKHHGHVHKKLGLRSHPDFDVYMEMLITICRHPNTTKDIIVDFDKSLGRLNPEYKAEINDAITKGLNSRGF